VFCRQKKNLLSKIHLTYKVVNLDIKRKKNKIFFLEFLKYWPSSRGFNKLVIKAKMHANIYFLKFSLLYENTIWWIFILFLFFERLGRMHENKNIFLFLFFNVLTKTRYFNTRFISLQYKNTNRYWSKWSKNFAKNHIF
jgi:hypothetical protein